jgi:protein-tyrosine phosphatase
MTLETVRTDCCDRCLDAVVDGAMNFRDLGGHRAGEMRLRRGLLYRSAMTHEIAPSGLRRLAKEYGLRTVIDLRSDEEIQTYGVAPFTTAGIAYYHHSVTSRAASPPEIVARYQQQMRDGTFDWTASYLRMVENGGAAFRAIFTVLAAPEAMPAVFHCIAGRDRTGVAAALLLGSLGVSAEDIAHDYNLTGLHLRAHAHRFNRQAERLSISHEQMVAILDTEAEAMHRFLEEITRRHGSIEGAVSSLGVEDETLARLRTALLEPA